jgi:small-conductance mechanosensitive channel
LIALIGRRRRLARSFLPALLCALLFAFAAPAAEKAPVEKPRAEKIATPKGAAAGGDPTDPSSKAEARPDDGPVPKDIRDGLAAIRATLDRPDPTPEALSDQMRKATALRAQAGECQQIGEDHLARVAQALAAIGEKQADESPELADRRTRIAQYKAREENRRAECRLAIVFADSLIGRIDSAQKNLLKQRLTRHGPMLTTVALWNLEHPHILAEAAASLMSDGFGLGDAAPTARILAFVAALIGVAFGWWARRGLAPLGTKAAGRSFAAQMRHSLAAAAARSVIFWAPAAGAAAVLVAANLVEGELSYAGLFGLAIAGFFTARIVIDTMLGPLSPLRAVAGIRERLGARLVRSLVVLAATVALVLALSNAPVRVSLPFEADRLARGVLVTVLVLNLGWLTWLIGQVPRLKRSGRALRVALLFALLVTLAAEWTGYRNLSAYLLQGLAETAVVFACFSLVAAFLAEACAELDEGRAPWSTRVRRHLGLDQAEGFPSLVWMRLLVTVSLWTAAGLLLLRAWGLSDSGTAMVLGFLVDGFAVGDVQFVPAKVVSGIIVFSVLLGGARWLRTWVETKWLSRSRMDRGAKDAVVTITGYLGFVVATLLGLSSAGVSMANLALIASALSVGIGFGLQHVVSNFVAGLILLFERPIKTGDWVVVGGTEGIVKRIRVRATEIRTFERSDVSVPNSELINAPVKNWTLRDRVGRALIPLGVAYGSDTDLVRTLLINVARAHPGIIQEAKSDPIKVWFRGFGDCALNFELAFTVRNVDERADVISDVDFAIDKAFRDHRVEIPYPQHEVRIRGLDGDDDIAGLIATARRARAAAAERPPGTVDAA